MARATSLATGTTDWQAPEVFMGTDMNTKGSDVFSLGLVFFFLLLDGDHALGGRAERKQTLMGIYNGSPTRQFASNLRRAGQRPPT